MQSRFSLFSTENKSSSGHLVYVFLCNAVSFNLAVLMPLYFIQSRSEEYHFLSATAGFFSMSSCDSYITPCYLIDFVFT